MAAKFAPDTEGTEITPGWRLASTDPETVFPMHREITPGFRLADPAASPTSPTSPMTSALTTLPDNLLCHIGSYLHSPLVLQMCCQSLNRDAFGVVTCKYGTDEYGHWEDSSTLAPSPPPLPSPTYSGRGLGAESMGYGTSEWIKDTWRSGARGESRSSVD
ncbi:hypothetical protein B484DRAFT_283182 [Ochromonadaceae sp. CCMP2298]|nr:hypothetical protein B484DRAFT_283182 [Ochromonadaceae sp. CCMP2298]